MRQPHRQTFLDVTVSFYGSLMGTVLSSIHLRFDSIVSIRGCIHVCSLLRPCRVSVRSSYVGMYATLDLSISFSLSLGAYIETRLLVCFDLPVFL